MEEKIKRGERSQRKQKSRKSQKDQKGQRKQKSQKRREILGGNGKKVQDLEVMINIAQELGEPTRQTSVVYRLGDVAAKLGMAARAQQVAEAASPPRNK